MPEKKRYNSRKIFGNILWTLLGLATVVLLGAAISLRNSKRCKGADINISGIQNNFFIDKKEISDMLQKLCNGAPQGKALGSFNLSSIENTLKKNEWIKNAELFFDNNEMLRVDVTEREPVARIFATNGSSFYLDSSLTILPLSDKSSARVPVFSNFPAQSNRLTKADSNLLYGIKNVSRYILNDPFWMAQIDQVDITPERTFEMVPKVGNQIIIFGSADNYEVKFNELLTFYKQVASKVGWNKYSKINVQYKGQVVAVKRGAEDVIQDLLTTKLIMQNIVVNAQRLANDSINNIQLEQQQDDNIIPLAHQLDDIPHEQPVTIKPPSVKADSLKTISPSTEKPIAIPAKPIVVEKKLSPSTEKPFWLKPAMSKPANVLKRSVSPKVKSKSIQRPNPYPFKKNGLLKAGTKTTTKPAIKATKKPVVKPVIKAATKPKAVLPPKNDY